MLFISLPSTVVLCLRFYSRGCFYQEFVLQFAKFPFCEMLEAGLFFCLLNCVDYLSLVLVSSKLLVEVRFESFWLKISALFQILYAKAFVIRP